MLTGVLKLAVDLHPAFAYLPRFLRLWLGGGGCKSIPTLYKLQDKSAKASVLAVKICIVPLN
jgi:hypothetical protein